MLLRNTLIGCILFALTTIVGAATNHVKLLHDTVRPLQWAELDSHTGELLPVATYCSVFSVNPKNRGWMTAAHCVADANGELYTDSFFIDGHPARVVEVDLKHDLALVQTTNWGLAVGLKLAKRGPVEAEPLEVLGYAWGLKKPFYFMGLTSVTSSDIGGFFGSFVAMPAVGGMSGSAVIDAEGRVVGVVHIRLGGNNGADPILGFTDWKTFKTYDRGWVFQR